MAGAHLVGVDGAWRGGAEVGEGKWGRRLQRLELPKGFPPACVSHDMPRKKSDKVQAEGEEEVMWRGVGEEEVKKAVPALGQLFRLEHY